MKNLTKNHMKKKIALIALSLGLTVLSPNLLFGAEIPLRQVQLNRNSLGLDEQLWEMYGQEGDRRQLLAAIDQSLTYLKTPSAAEDYQNHPVPGITRERVIRSLNRFRQLLVNSRNAREFQAAVEREFTFYKSVGRDNRGEVFFTGYFEPIYEASRVPTAEYRYPLYRRPENLESWPQPHPTRAQLQGDDGLGLRTPLAGYELVWLRDRFEAFLVEIQGSARLRLPDGSIMSVNYDGNTDYAYQSIGKEMIKDGVFPADGLTLPVMIEYFRANPQELDRYLPRNNRFIFLRETHGAKAMGSIGVPVTEDRSIATDKSLMPPGALALVRTRIPYFTETGTIETPVVSRYVLDQDTGSAIKGPGRVDLFMGTGPFAGDRAGIIGWTGELYYLLLK